MKPFTRPAQATLAIVIGLTALTACSGGSKDQPSDTASNGADQVTVTYANFISNGGNEDNLAQIVTAFEAANPGIKVQVATLPYADYFTALQTDLAGGTVADVFDIEYANYATYQASNVFAPMTDVDASVYQKSLVEAYSTNGTQYALPTSFSNVVLFYNKDLFDAAGVDYPTKDWTWAEERAAAEKLTDAANGIWGDYQPISYHEFYKAVAQAGGDFLTPDAGQVAFNSPAGQAAAEWLIGKSGSVMPTSEQGAGTPDFDSQLFANGKLAMWHTGIWNFGVPADSTFAWDIAVEPGDQRHASAMFSNAVAISAGCKNTAAAQKWVNFLTSSTTMVDIRLGAGWELPPIADQTQLNAYLGQGQPDNRQAVFDSLEAVALAPSIGQNQAQMQDAVTDELTEAAAGRKTVDEALAAAESKVNALLG